MRHVIFSMLLLFGMQVMASPVSELLDRIEPGTSKSSR